MWGPHIWKQTNLKGDACSHLNLKYREQNIVSVYKMAKTSVAYTHIPQDQAQVLNACLDKWAQHTGTKVSKEVNIPFVVLHITYLFLFLIASALRLDQAIYQWLFPVCDVQQTCLVGRVPRFQGPHIPDRCPVSHVLTRWFLSSWRLLLFL